MERILLLGPPGSGKSTLAKRLGSELELPVIHLDEHFWEPGWTMPPEVEWIETQRALIDRHDRWIMDGNYDSTLEVRLPEADTVILLELGRLRSLYRIAKRWWDHRGAVREDMADGCPERFDLEFALYAWSFKERELPEIKEKIDQFGSDVDTITLDASSPEALEEFIERYTAQ